MATRRMAREVALKALYAVESSGDPIAGVVEHLASEEGLPDRLRDFARALCRHSWEGRKQYDDLIAGKAEHWALHRIARIDRIILRMALAEYFAFKDVPRKVIINEAIELARQYSTAKSPGFVNGVLDALIMQTHHRDTECAEKREKRKEKREKSPPLTLDASRFIFLLFTFILFSLCSLWLCGETKEGAGGCVMGSFRIFTET